MNKAPMRIIAKKEEVDEEDGMAPLMVLMIKLEVGKVFITWHRFFPAITRINGRQRQELPLWEYLTSFDYI